MERQITFLGFSNNAKKRRCLMPAGKTKAATFKQIYIWLYIILFMALPVLCVLHSFFCPSFHSSNLAFVCLSEWFTLKSTVPSTFHPLARAPCCFPTNECDKSRQRALYVLHTYLSPFSAGVHRFFSCCIKVHKNWNCAIKEMSQREGCALERSPESPFKPMCICFWTLSPLDRKALLQETVV